MRVFFVFLLFPSILSAQQTESFVDKDTVKVGFPIKLTYRVKMNGNFPWVKSSTKIFPSFTLESPKDTAFVELVKEEILSDVVGWQRFETTLIPWDTGRVVLKSKTYKLGDSLLYFSSDTVVVATGIIEGNADIVDIREKFFEKKKNIPEKKQSNIWIYWIYALVGFGLFSGLLYWLWQKRKKKSAQSLLKTPKDRALNQLENLKNTRSWESDQKQYYDKLSWILRTYLTEEYCISLMDKTTSETKILLKKMGLQKHSLLQIEELLNSADLVKFAASSSSNVFAEEKLEMCIRLIDSLDNSEENVE